MYFQLQKGNALITQADGRMFWLKQYLITKQGVVVSNPFPYSDLAVASPDIHHQSIHSHRLPRNSAIALSKQACLPTFTNTIHHRITRIQIKGPPSRKSLCPVSRRLCYPRGHP